jgi:hypothetical protein
MFLDHRHTITPLFHLRIGPEFILIIEYGSQKLGDKGYFSVCPLAMLGEVKPDVLLVF